MAGVRDRPILTASIGALGAVLAAVITVVATRSPAPPAPEPRPSASASPAQSDFERLLSFLPDTVSSCVPEQAPLGSTARVACAAPPDHSPVTADVSFTLYDGIEPSRLAFREVVPAAVTATERVCPKGPDRSDYNAGSDEPAGLLACWMGEDGVPYIVWTRDDPGILAIAVGPEKAKLKDLWKFWLNASINYEHQPSEGATVD